MTSDKFTNDDIIVVGYCKRIIRSQKNPNTKKLKHCHIFKKFYMRNTLDVIERYTNQYVTVYKLSIYRGNDEYVMDSTDGLSVIDIANLIIASCRDTLPFNVITNSSILSSILKYVFSNYVAFGQFPNRNYKCTENKKNNPKVVIWYVFHRRMPKRLLNYPDIVNFIQKSNYKIKFYKKHVFLNEFFDPKKMSFKISQDDAINPLPYICETYGGMDGDEQGTVGCIICLNVDPLPENNVNIADSLAFLQKKKFIRIYEIKTKSYIFFIFPKKINRKKKQIFSFSFLIMV